MVVRTKITRFIRKCCGLKVDEIEDAEITIALRIHENNLYQKHLEQPYIPFEAVRREVLCEIHEDLKMHILNTDKAIQSKLDEIFKAQRSLHIGGTQHVALSKIADEIMATHHEIKNTLDKCNELTRQARGEERLVLRNRAARLVLGQIKYLERKLDSEMARIGCDGLAPPHPPSYKE